MHVHILGICGTFMGGIAAIAKAAGHRVTGSDKNVYPPMSSQLEALGIELIAGFDAAQLKPRPDVVVVGNVMTRGVPVIEALLDSDIPYASGPEWLACEVLRDVQGVTFTFFTAHDVVRHPLVQRIVRAYEKRDENNDAPPSR